MRQVLLVLLAAADRDGNARPVDIPDVRNYGADAFTDMGAYEMQL